MRAELSSGWTRAQRRLHWWTAVLVLLAFPLGWVMVGVPISQLLLKFLPYQLHKTLGILVFVLVVARLVVRARRGRPRWDEDLPAWQRQAAGAVHVVFRREAGTPKHGDFARDLCRWSRRSVHPQRPARTRDTDPDVARPGCARLIENWGHKGIKIDVNRFADTCRSRDHPSVDDIFNGATDPRQLSFRGRSTR